MFQLERKVLNENKINVPVIKDQGGARWVLWRSWGSLGNIGASDVCHVICVYQGQVMSCHGTSHHVMSSHIMHCKKNFGQNYLSCKKCMSCESCVWNYPITFSDYYVVKIFFLINKELCT